MTHRLQLPAGLWTIELELCGLQGLLSRKEEVSILLVDPPEHAPSAVLASLELRAELKALQTPGDCDRAPLMLVDQLTAGLGAQISYAV